MRAVSQLRLMSQFQVEIESVYELPFGSGPPVVRREGEHPVRNAYADKYCITTLKNAAVAPLFDLVGERLAP